jgi:hypothetical protein
MTSSRSDELTLQADTGTREPRKRALLAARIVFNNGSSTVDCQLRNISENGARLALFGAATLPEEFELRLPEQGYTRRVRVVWQRGTDIGVRYLDVFRKTDNRSAEAALCAEVRELKAEVARLQARILELTQG